MSDGDLVSLFFRAAVDNTAIYYDDLWIDSSAENLANPIPEPGTVALLALGVFGLIAHRRWRRR